MSPETDLLQLGWVIGILEGEGCFGTYEDYLGPQGNKHWRGCLMFHEVKDGQFDLMPVSLDYLNKKYA